MSDTLPTATRVADPGLRAIYAQDNRWQAWLDVEVALARAQAELGIIPTEAATVIARVARLDALDRTRIEEGLARTGHTLVPLVWELARVVGVSRSEAGRGNRALVADGFATTPERGFYRLTAPLTTTFPLD